MKKLFIILLILSTATISFSQEVRDHRNGNKTPSLQNTPVKPTPVAGNHQAGAPVTSIDPNKWYYIKKAGSDKYMQISGHKNLTQSYAVLAIEEMQQDNTGQQWRFVSYEESGNTIYKLQNRKYSGYLYTAPFEFYMEFKRDRNSKKNINAFLLVLNPDKSWYILTRTSGNKYALSIWKHKGRHCMPAESAPLIGGRVLLDYECADEMYREYVRAFEFTGKSEQKWILEEVMER